MENTDSNKQFFIKAQELLWSRPERKKQKAKIAIIGGHAQGFSSIPNTYQSCLQHGAGEVRVLLPDALNNKLPPLPDIDYVDSTPQGSFAHSAVMGMLHQSEWADIVYLPGELSNNSETVLAIEEFVSTCSKPILVQGQAISLATHSLGYQPKQVTLVMELTEVQALTKYHKLSYTITSGATAEVVRESISKLAADLQAIIIYLSAESTIVSDGVHVLSFPARTTEVAKIAVLQGEFPNSRLLATVASLS